MRIFAIVLTAVALSGCNQMWDREVIGPKEHWTDNWWMSEEQAAIKKAEKELDDPDRSWV
jgi:hypothetical protein